MDNERVLRFLSWLVLAVIISLGLISSVVVKSFVPFIATLCAIAVLIAVSVLMGVVALLPVRIISLFKK